MAIRLARFEDAASIAEVHVRSWQAAYRGILPDDYLEGLSIEKRKEMWQGILRRDSKHCLLCEREGRVVGFASVGQCRDEDIHGQRVGEIYAIYLLESAWGHGLGRALCAEALNILRKERCTAATLWVLAENRRAIDFYAAAGFQADGREKIDRESACLEYRQIRMQRKLDQISGNENSA